MINSREYEAYMKENNDFLQAFQNINSLTYIRLSNLIKLLNIIVDMDKRKKNISDELEIIFDSGFTFLSDQIEDIKIYFNNFFDEDFDLLFKYEHLINVYLTYEDLMVSIKEQSVLDADTKKTIEHILFEIEDVLKYRKEFINEKYQEFDEVIQDISNRFPNVKITLEIFEEIYDQLAN
jgi:hypothetical protein